MRIDDGTRTPQAAAVETGKPSPGGTAPDDHGPPPADTTDLSSLALTVSAPDEAGQKRLETLRAAVANGTYQVASSDLAANIIESHLIKFHLKPDQ